MKGTRAKKAAEAAAAEAGESIVPAPPSEPRDGPARPGKIATSNGAVVQIPEEEFKRLCGEMRMNKLIGPAAADAIEAAAGIGCSSPQGKKAADMREKVADSREGEEKKPKEKMGGFAAAEEIPDEPEPPPAKSGGRASISQDADAMANDLENIQNHCEKDAPEPPELNLNPKQNQLRTDIEMWVMDEIPPVFGVDDSEELDEALQEDNQANMVTFLIAATEEAEQESLAQKWLESCPDKDKLAEFISTLLEKCRAVQAAGAKKKKKKKKAE